MLFKNTQKLLEYAELTSAVNFVSIKATLRLVENYHVIPYLGKELYNALDSAYSLIGDETGLSPANQLLLDKCRCVIGPMVCYYYAPKAEVKLGDGGLTKHKDAAYQYQGTNFREANLREGEAATELLLEFLEENKSSYPEWVSSTAFAEYRSLLIRSGREFQHLFPSHTPYRNYNAMRAKMLDVEEHNIRKAIGDALYDDLKVKAKKSDYSFSEVEEQLLFKLKKAIANLTVSFSVPLLLVRIDAGGITVMNQGYSSRDEDAKKSSADANAINALIDRCADSGKAWLDDATKFLNDHKTDFPLWQAEETDDEYPGSAKPGFNGLFGMC